MVLCRPQPTYILPMFSPEQAWTPACFWKLPGGKHPVTNPGRTPHFSPINLPLTAWLDLPKSEGCSGLLKWPWPILPLLVLNHESRPQNLPLAPEEDPSWDRRLQLPASPNPIHTYRHSHSHIYTPRWSPVAQAVWMCRSRGVFKAKNRNILWISFSLAFYCHKNILNPI